MRLSPLALKIINAVFLLAVLGFLAAYLVSVDWQGLLQASVDWPLLALSVVPALGALLLMSATWVRTLQQMNPAVRYSPALLGVYSKSWLGRYLPGKVTWLAGKMHFASHLGIPMSQLGVGSILEVGVQILSQSILALVLILLTGNAAALPAELQVLMYPALAVGLLVLLPPVFNRLVSLVFRLLKKEQRANLQFSPRSLAELAGLYALAFLGQGVGYALIITAVTGPLPFAELVFAVASVGLSVLAGILAVFAPGGIGVRDGLSALMLSAIMEPQLAVLCALLLRLFSLASDLTFFALGRLIDRKQAGQKPQS